MFLNPGNWIPIPRKSQGIPPTKQPLKVIGKEIGDSFFSILIDESHEASCKLTLVLRFIGIKHVDDTSSLSLKVTVYSMLSNHGLSFSKIRGQGYNGASAFNGLKTLIMNYVPSSNYFHYFAHQLQLALVFVAKNYHDINDFFELTSRLLNMIGSSYKRRDKLRDKQATRVVATLADGDLESGIGLNHEIGIKRPNDTRCSSHYSSLLKIKIID
ncbi:hypothetical protein OSB04_006953 [Centaurea solstitialis]|uniref:DUF4371 domain-containing protein n=1 Tax=Centaurea solstitialis TaxID=347529 RepID=A0AA38TIX4_9ASTR|nr:hypothetical protein OSB04_006953 [Centaurea solstitialis]